MILRLSASALGLALILASCTKPVAKPTFGKNGGTKDAGGKYDPTSEPKTPVVKVTPELPSEIQLVNTKFTGEESKLEAIIKYNGVTSPRYKLEAESGLATITAPNLLTAKSDTLVVEIYEAEKLRFIARRIATTVEKGKANSWKLEDCLVTKVPWDGEKNEGSCGWTVQDVK